jgi:hypothetical protein
MVCRVYIFIFRIKEFVMRQWITCCLVVLFIYTNALASENILDPSVLSLNSQVSGVEVDAGNWKSARYGFEVANAGNNGQVSQAVHSKWKAFASHFKFNKPLLDGDQVTFSFCKTTSSQSGSIYIIFTSKGEYHAGLEISNDLSIGYFDSQAKNKNKITSVPTGVFQSRQDTWHKVRMVFHPNGKTDGTYDLFIDDQNIKNDIRYAFSENDLTDGLSLRGCNNDKGGREIFLGAFTVKRAGQTLEQFNRTVELSLDLSPIASEVGTVFVAGKPVGFDVHVKGYSPDLDVRWAIKSLYFNRDFQSPNKIKINQNGVGRIQLPQDTLRQTYLLQVSVHKGQQVLLSKELRFAVMSAPDQTKVDVEREWLGIDTVELSTKDQNFEKIVKALKLMGIHWVRKKHMWAHQYPSLESGPKMDELVNVVDRLAQENIRCLEDIQGTPMWASDAPKDGVNRWKYPPAKWEYWNTYAHEMVKALGDRTQYQMWCEPASWMAIDRIEKQYPDGIPQVLEEYWKRCREAINQWAPNAKLIGPAASSGNMSLVHLSLRNGSWKYLDAISYHYPKWPNTPRSTNQRVLRDMVRYAGKKMPLVIDESLPLAYNDDEGKSSRFQTNLKSYIRYWAEGLVDRFYVYVLQAPDGHGNLLSYSFQPSGGIVALQALIHRTRQSQFLAKIHLHDQVESYLYRKDDGKLCIALWHESKAGKALRLGDVLGNWQSSQTQCYDAFNNPFTEMNIELSDIPVYVEGVRAVQHEQVLVQLQPVELRVDSGLKLPVTLAIANLKNQSIETSIVLDDPNAIIQPATIKLALKPNEVIRRDITIEPRVPTRTGFTSESVKAQVNGKTQTIGYAQYYNHNAIKTVDAGQFGQSEHFWQINSDSGLFEHGKASDSVLNENQSQIAYRPIRRGDGKLWGEFTANIKPMPRKSWFGINYSRNQPFEIPGIPVKMRFKVHATTDMMPSNAGLLLHFVDAKGKGMRYEITPFISPTDKHDVLVMEEHLDSPMTNSYRHSQWNVKDSNRLYYPLKFVGFSINPTPQRDRKARWKGAIQVQAIEFDYYDPPVPVESVMQMYDPTPQF